MENDTNANFSPKRKEERHKNQTDFPSSLSPESTVNPKISKSRVEDGEGDRKTTDDKMVGIGQDTNIEE